MDIQIDPWLTNIFGYDVFKVNIVDVDKEINDILQYHRDGQARAFYYVKIPTSQIHLTKQLQDVGFYVVDVNTTFVMDQKNLSMDAEPNELAIGDFPEYSQEVLKIAGSCFKYSRFHLDPLIPNVLANQIKHDWALNYVNKKRGDNLLTAVKNKITAGFLAAAVSESESKRVAAIELVGVSEFFQRQGIGKALIRQFIKEYHGQCDCLQVGTQAANIPSMRMYEKMGFFIADTKYIMHMHHDNRQL